MWMLTVFHPYLQLWKVLGDDDVQHVVLDVVADFLHAGYDKNSVEFVVVLPEYIVAEGTAAVAAADYSIVVVEDIAVAKYSIVVVAEDSIVVADGIAAVAEDSIVVVVLAAENILAVVLDEYSIVVAAENSVAVVENIAVVDVENIAVLLLRKILPLLPYCCCCCC